MLVAHQNRQLLEMYFKIKYVQWLFYQVGGLYFELFWGNVAIGLLIMVIVVPGTYTGLFPSLLMLYQGAGPN